MRPIVVAALLTAILLPACSGPSYQRGSDDPSIDLAAMSTGLDRVDLERALDDWFQGFNSSPFANRVTPGDNTISVLEITNETSQHIGSALRNLISSVETGLANSGRFRLINNDEVLKSAIMQERMRGDAVDPDTMAALGKELGVHYFVYGRVGESAEKTRNAKRVQYFLFLKVTEVATRQSVYQQQIDITKQISG